MSLLNAEVRTQVEDAFAGLDNPVKMLVFTQTFECQYCKETRQLVEEVSELSDKLSVEVYDFVNDKEVVEEYGIDKIPALVVATDGDEVKDYGIRFYGIPSGYEFSTLIEDIRMVSSQESGLSNQSKGMLEDLTQPLHLQVFVTPTCPYCTQAVRMAHMMALESDMVTADMVEATEFPELSNKYQVMGVPRTVINEDAYIEGAVPEGMLMAKVEEVLA